MGSSPRPPRIGAWGRYPNDPSSRTLPRWRSCGVGSPTSTEMKEDLPVPLRPDQPHLLAGADHEGGVGEQGAVTDLDGEG